MDREERERRRDSFLGDADDYFAARPGYPDGLLDEAVLLGDLRTGDRLLEVGCGTGQATIWFAERSFDVLATDRSPEMARRAARRLEAFENVEVSCADFEEEEDLAHDFAGLLLATSYHWLNPETRVERCAAALRSGGALMLLWHTHPHPFTGYFERSQDVYQELVPGWKPPSSPGMAEEGIQGIVTELTAAGVFGPIERRTHDWTRSYDLPLYLRLLDTYSDHRLLKDSIRAALYDALAHMIREDFDGVVERPYRSELLVGRRA